MSVMIKRTEKKKRDVKLRGRGWKNGRKKKNPEKTPKEPQKKKSIKNPKK